MSKKYPSTIGYETVYLQQWEIAHEAMKTLNKGERTPLVLLQPQAGKTGVIEAACYEFIQSCQKRKKTFQVIVLCGLPLTDLAEQTKSRLNVGISEDSKGSSKQGALLGYRALDTGLLRVPTSEYLREGVVVLHNSTTLKKTDFNMKVDERLIIIDEVHIGNVKNGNIDAFLRNHGVKVSEQRHTWDNRVTKNRLIVVSATPFAHSILSKDFCKTLEDKALFETIYREPPPNYNSIEAMMKNGRIREVEPLFTDNKPTSFLRQLEADFKKDCRKKGAGLLVIRATGKSHARLMNYINRTGNIEVKEFDATCNNISELNSYLSSKPVKPTWVVIRGAMRAGITLGKENYIRAWVETSSNQCDVQVQSGVGRACGYDRKETYPIYCTVSAVMKVVDYYQSLKRGSLETIPASRHNRSVHLKREVSLKFISLEQAKKEMRQRTEELRKKGQKLPPGKTRDYQLSKTSSNVVDDIAKKVLDGVSYSGRTFGYHINGPSDNLKFKSSYKRLLQVYPNCEGMVAKLVYGKGTSVKLAGGADSLQKKSSALRKDGKTSKASRKKATTKKGGRR